MCLKFDPEENTIKQTCSGKCKNKCGFKLDHDRGAEKSSLKDAHRVQIETLSAENQFFKAPLLSNNSSLDIEQTKKTVRYYV